MCLVRPILNLAWITYGVYVLKNCSECCVMLSRGHYLAIYETLALFGVGWQTWQTTGVAKINILKKKKKNE